MADTTLSKAQPAAYTPRTNLDAAIASQPDEAWVAAAGPRAHGFLIKIDDEYEFVTHHGDQFARPWQVERGALGSTKAAHSNGATVSVEPAIGVSGTDGIVSIPNLSGLQFPSGTLSDLGGGAASVGLLVSLIGPFLIAHNTAGITDTVNGGAALALLPTGSIIIRAWCEVTTQFALATGQTLVLAVAPDSDPTDWYGVTTYKATSNVIDVQGDTLVPQEAATSDASQDNFFVTRVTAAGRLRAILNASSAAGAGKVYAIVASPAA